MSKTVERVRLRELFEGPPLELAVRNALAERVVGWLLGPLLVVALASDAIVFATAGLSEPTRFIPSAALLLPMPYAVRLWRTGRWLQAAAVLNAMLFVAIAAGVLLNSVHAPVYAAGFILEALVILQFGNRWGLATAAALLGVGVLSLVLQRFGLGHENHPAATTRVGLYLGYMVMSLVILGSVQRLLADALNDAHAKQREAETARAAEAASELAFHEMFDQASVGMVLLTSSGVIKQLNQRATSWFSAVEHTLTGRALQTAELWDDAQRGLLATAISAATDGRVSSHELTVGQGSTKQRVYQVNVSPFHNHGGSLGQVIVEVIDVTDLIQTRAMLAQARRLEALGKLSGGVAHDINNMLSAILGACELAGSARGSVDPKSIAFSLEIIQSAVVRASSLTKQLLAFGRQDRFDSTTVDVGRLVRDMSRLFERTLHKNVAVTVTPSQRPIELQGDLAALENALLNLALNAQDAMASGGTLTVSTELVDLDAEACARLNGEIAAGPTVVIRVSDTGSGISEAVRERMFEPFFTTKPVGKGTGLGLAAVYGTVRNHRGAITVESQEDVGSTFALYFPAAQVASAVAAPSEAPRAPSSLHARVLLADDEPLVRDALASILRSLGCEVQTVGDGTSLIDALATGAAPDVVVSDLMMPGLSGIGLVQAIEATRPGCPLLLITGFTSDDISTALSGRSHHRLLRKPFLQAELVDALEALLPGAVRYAVQRSAC